MSNDEVLDLHFDIRHSLFDIHHSNVTVVRNTMIYLDHSATTPLDERVLDAMLPFMREEFANASSIYGAGRRMRIALEDARERFARSIGITPAEIIFTSGGTESDNAAMFSSRDREGALLVSAVEHHAVLAPAEKLSEEGKKVITVGVSSDGTIDEEKFLDALKTSRPALVSVMMVNNEVGTINDVKHLARIAHDAGALFHTDAVQALGLCEINLRDFDVDMASFSSHKIYGPKGVGALYIKAGVKISPFIIGGAQERNRRGGTESVALAVGFATARDLASNSREKEWARLTSLKKEFERLLQTHVEGVRFNHPESSIPSIVNVAFDEAMYTIDGEALLIGLDMEGIAASNGAACTSGSVQPSHVLKAMGRSDAVAHGSVRFSMGRSTTVDDITKATEALVTVVTRMRT